MNAEKLRAALMLGGNSEIIRSAAQAATVAGDVAARDAGDDYETTARAFLTLTGARFAARYLGVFDSASEWGEDDGAKVRGYIPVWCVTISTAAGRLSVRFRGSIMDGRRGVVSCSVYSVLACLTKYAPGSFDEFAREFGYFPISSSAAYHHAVKVWRGCRREFAGVCRVWPSEDDRQILESIN